MHLYMLDDDGEPVPVADVLLWAAWFETADRVVKQDYDESAAGRVGLSTIFLGIDSDYTGSGVPVLWESLIFGTPLDGTMRRYTSRADALAGHAELLAELRAAYRAGS